MGFELETEAFMDRLDRAATERLSELERRWQQAGDEIARATEALRSLSADAASPTRVEHAHARLAAARRRRLALAEQMEQLEAEHDDGEIWR